MDELNDFGIDFIIPEVTIEHIERFYQYLTWILDMIATSPTNVLNVFDSTPQESFNGKPDSISDFPLLSEPGYIYASEFEQLSEEDIRNDLEDVELYEELDSFLASSQDLPRYLATITDPINSGRRKILCHEFLQTRANQQKRKTR
ncbi:MAG: hypothetical protein R3C11_05065 [Planctomycetaceae bacterium]